MAAERKTLTQLSVPIGLETLFYMLSGMVDTLMLSSVSDQAVGAVGTANTYIGVFIIMFGVISSGMIAVMSQNIGAGRPGKVRLHSFLMPDHIQGLLPFQIQERHLLLTTLPQDLSSVYHQ